MPQQGPYVSRVSDGTTTVSPAGSIIFTAGATVTRGTEGNAEVAIEGGTGNPGGATNSTQINAGDNVFGGVDPGTSGQVLTSNGSGSAPSYQDASGGATLIVTDGTTTIDNVGTLSFSGATVSGTTPTADVMVSGAGPVTEVRVALTSTQLLHLFSSPVTIIASPGAGKLIVVDNVAFSLTFNSIPYVTTDDTINLFYNNFPAGDGAIPPIAGLFQSSDSEVWIGTAVSTNFPAAIDADQPIILTSQVANMTAGDGTGSVTVLYHVVTL